MISWFKYDPSVEIKKLTIPVMIIQGTNDIQVSVDEAQRLATAYPSGKLLVIKDMNHVLKIVPGDREANIKSYDDPKMQVSSEMISEIVKFINEK